VLTTDLTTEDVSELANRVRESMLVALREISDPAPSAPKSTQPSYAQSTIRARDRTPRPKTPPVEIEEPQTVVDEPVPPKPFADKDVSHESLASDFSLGGQRRTESASGAETEEDEGMVLVSRPSS
jgi:lysophosphatidate acyltransferase